MKKKSKKTNPTSENLGWVKVHRSLLDNPVWTTSTPEQRSVLVSILLKANHKTNTWAWKGEKFTVKPGQFVTSLESLRKASGKGISTQNVRSSLRLFKKFDFLTEYSTKNGRLISIINWASYQQKVEDGNTEVTKGATPNKNNKKIKNKKANNNAHNNITEGDSITKRKLALPSQKKEKDDPMSALLDAKCDELEKKGFKDVFVFKNEALKKKKHPRAILTALDKCKVYFASIKNHKAYCWKIINVESGNENYNDYLEKIGDYKGGKLPDEVKGLISAHIDKIPKNLCSGAGYK